jgi:hypothetical protein
MPTFHFVTESAIAGVPVSSPPCATIEGALRGEWRGLHYYDRIARLINYSRRLGPRARPSSA